MGTGSEPLSCFREILRVREVPVPIFSQPLRSLSAKDIFGLPHYSSGTVLASSDSDQSSIAAAAAVGAISYSSKVVPGVNV